MPSRAGQTWRLPYRNRLAPRHLAIFLVGFAKNEQDNVDDDEIHELKALARGFLALREDRIVALAAEDELIEVEYAEDS